MQYKVCVFTAARSEYGLLRWIMQEIKDDASLKLQVLVTGMHLEPKFGLTYKEILKDGFAIDAKVKLAHKSDTAVDIAQTIAQGTSGLTKALNILKPDFVVMMGDRFELLSLLCACLVLQIPVAHISGGELTEGAFDNQIRHAATKMSHLHFVANSIYAKRVKQMGEEGWRVITSGEPGLDNIYRLKFLSQKELEKDLGIDLSIKTAIVTFHPVTLEQDQIESQLNHLFTALQKAGLQYVITYPNSDPGNQVIRQRIEKFIKNYKGVAKGFVSLGQKRYLSLLKYVSMMIGNSSSGIFEAPSFNLPTVNIGSRQKGRVFGLNVIQTGYDSKSILKGISQALNYKRKFCKNPYGNGKSSQIVKNVIKQTLQKKSRDTILRKKFNDI